MIYHRTDYGAVLRRRTQAEGGGGLTARFSMKTQGCSLPIGVLGVAEAECQKFEFRPTMDAADMLDLGVEIEEIGAALIRASDG